MNIAHGEFSGDYMIDIDIPYPTLLIIHNSAPFLPSSSAALITDGKVVTTATKTICLVTNGVAICAHISNQEKWTPETFDSVDWEFVAAAMAK